MALPHTSRPARASAMESRWMAKGSVMPWSARTLTRRGETPRDSKVSVSCSAGAVVMSVSSMVFGTTIPARPSGPRIPLSSGRADSTALTRPSSSGVDHRAEARDLAPGGDEELLEVPLDVAVAAVGVGHGGELGVERVAPVAVHLDLLGQRERDAVGGGAERGDLLGAARLLSAELVARHAEDREALVGVLLVHLLEALVLGREAALRGHVHDEERLVLVVVEVERGAVEAVEGVVVDRHGGEPTGGLAASPVRAPRRRRCLPSAGGGPARPRGPAPVGPTR